MMRKRSWGIVRYLGSQSDPTVFDGWYSERKTAQEVFEHCKANYPGWAVALVMASDIKFPDPRKKEG